MRAWTIGVATTIGIALVTAAIVSGEPPRPGTQALLSSELDLPRQSFAVEGGSVELQGGVTRDPDLKTKPFDVRYPTLYFIRAVNATTDSVWLELQWDIGEETEFPVRSPGVALGGHHAFFQPSDGVLDRPITVHVRVFADAAHQRPLGGHDTQMRFSSKERRRLLKRIPHPFSGRGTEETFGQGRDVPILSGWPASKDSKTATAKPRG